jgi:hypothetical protein
MGQPGMRVTVDAAMRARDVSRPGTGADLPDQADRSDRSVPSASRPEPAPTEHDGSEAQAEQDRSEQGGRQSKVARRRFSKRQAHARR